MSYLVFQVGQCGNQLGYNFFNTLTDAISRNKTSKNLEFVEESDSRFFSYSEKQEKKFANAILLDAEERVIREAEKAVKNTWCYAPNHSKTQQIGSGNNWAMGYKLHGPVFEEFTMDIARKEIEQYDQLYGFLLLGSVAGGTGSGLGSYVLKLLRDEYPSTAIANVSVWPFEKGEVCVQAYNSILSLSALQNFSDAVFVVENDWLSKMCHQKLDKPRASMNDLNTVISEQLVNLLLPVDSCDNVKLTLNDLLAQLVPHPQFKLVGLRSAPQEPLSSLPYSSYSWSGLLCNLRRMFFQTSVTDKVCGPKDVPKNFVNTLPVTLTNLLLLRGKGCESVDVNNLHKPIFPYASWVPSSSRINTWTCSNPLLPYNKTALLANNGQLSTFCVDKAVEKSWRMFSCKAYFHHFESFGLTKEDFLSSHMNVQQILSSYNSLCV